MIKKLGYTLLFAAPVAVMVFLASVKFNLILIETEITGLDIIKGAIDNNAIFTLIAFGIAIISPLVAAITSLFVKPKHLANMFTFLSAGAIFFFGWPILYQIGWSMDVISALNGNIFTIFENFKVSELITPGLGAIIAAGICVGGAVLSLVLKLTDKPQKKQKAKKKKK